MRIAFIAALIVLFAAATTGCAATSVVTTPASHPPSPTEPTSALTRHVPCFDGHQRLVGPQVVRRFHAVAAVSCIDGQRIYPGHGQWSVRVRRVAASGIASLQRYFERPSRHDLPKGGVCLLVAHFILTPMLMDARGRSIAPRTPVDACGTPLGKLPSVPWHVDSVRKLKLMVSAPALAAHCAMGIKDVPAGGIGPLQPVSGGPLFPSTPETVKVCIYRTEDFEVGRFVRGLQLDPVRTRRLLRALTRAAPQDVCSNQLQFAVITAKHVEGNSVWVELGGCFRVARSYRGYTLGSADGSVVRSILGG
jgi:hypothetical protein